MASKNNDERPIIGTLIFTSLLVWGIGKLWYLYSTSYAWVLAVMGIFAAAGSFQILGRFAAFLHNIRLLREAYGPSENKGTASWANSKELKQEGLYNTDGLFLGLDTTGHPIFFDGETHGLTLSPAGGGKTISMAIPALCHSSLPMIVTDMKGTLACMTKKVREEKHGHEVHCLNPAGLYEDILGSSACYNPVDVLSDNWENKNNHKHVVSDSQDMALQLLPDPVVQTDNVFFRNGSRKLIAFGLLYLVTQQGKKANLGKLLRLLRKTDELMDAFYVASCSDVLNRELADMAQDQLTKFKAADNQRQTESFREGAIQVLEPFGTSGFLEEVTSKSDFRFKDAKTIGDKKKTIYLIVPPTEMKSFGPLLGVTGWAAIKELTRCQTNDPVLFLLDEATNFKIEGLPNALTALREYGIRCWFLFQELEEFARTYGRPALETLLSQTEAKQIFGVTSQKTAELVSNMLGEETVKSSNYSLGHSLDDKVQKSMSESGRKLLTPDEVRRFPDSILFIGNMKPIHAHKVGYHEVKPWSKWVGINPLHGKKLKGKARMKLRY